MQYRHFVHMLKALADLSDEHHSIQLHQSVVFINNPVKEFSSTNTDDKNKCKNKLHIQQKV